MTVRDKLMLTFLCVLIQRQSELIFDSNFFDRELGPYSNLEVNDSNLTRESATCRRSCDVSCLTAVRWRRYPWRCWARFATRKNSFAARLPRWRRPAASVFARRTAMTGRRWWRSSGGTDSATWPTWSRTYRWPWSSTTSYSVRAA